MPDERQATAADAVLSHDFSAAAALLDGHGSLGLARGITRAQLDGLFNFCYDHYLAGDYETAWSGFELLCLYDHRNARNWLGYGYSLLALKRHDKAAACLFFGWRLMEPGSAAWGEAGLATVRLLLQLEERERALAGLQTLVDELPETDMRAQAIALREALEDGQA